MHTPEVTPGYSLIVNGAQKFFETFRHEFHGPGFYLTRNETLLVTAEPPDEMPNDWNPWSREQPKGTVYRCHVFACPFIETVYAYTIPTHLDVR